MPMVAGISVSTISISRQSSQAMATIAPASTVSPCSTSNSTCW